MKTSGVAKYVCVALGIRATPADGDPCFGGMFYDSGYQVVDDGGAVTVNIPFAGWASNADTMIYANPWGTLLHANAAATAVNSAVGFDNPTGGATANGGYMVYHCLASSGAGHTATLKVQDAAVNNDGGFADLAGCTTGVIAVNAGTSGICVPTTTTVRQYLRWQIVLGTATSTTFVMGFFRNFPKRRKDMATGRTVTKWIRFALDDSSGTPREIPVDSISPVGFVYDETDLTAWQDAVKGYLSNHPDAPIDITGPFDNAAAAALAGTGAAPTLSWSHTILYPLTAPTFVTPLGLAVVFGIRGYWANGDPVFGIVAPSATSGYVCTKYQVEGEKYSARFVQYPGTTPAWGTAILT